MALVTPVGVARRWGQGRGGYFTVSCPYDQVGFTMWAFMDVCVVSWSYHF